MTIEYKPNPSGNAKIYGPSSAFKLRYEFVDTALGGAPMEPLPIPSAMPEPAALTQSQVKSCDRIYRSLSTKRGIFRSPSNVFMYGRGGSPNISCTIRFEANSGESVRYVLFLFFLYFDCVYSSEKINELRSIQLSPLIFFVFFLD